MNSIRQIDKSLEKAIEHIVEHKEQYVQNPKTNFTRNRKFPMKDVITQIISMNGGSLKKELYNFSKIRKTVLTPSAFVQQRCKISSIAFRDILRRFNEQCKDIKTYRGYRLMAVDGSDINCFRNPESENFLSTSQNPKGYNQIHLNALYDICNRTYIDLHLQPRKKGNERKALIHMLKDNSFQHKNIIITDRGYEGYNIFAHFINTENVDFLCRLRHGAGVMYEVQNLPVEEIDTEIVVEITTTQTNEDKLRKRRFLQTGSKKGKINSKNTKIHSWDFPSPYILKFRVVRFMLDTGEYETIATSLKKEEFTAEEIKELYRMRWGIETSFRELKYIIGLTHLHCKKDEFIKQEIYASIIMYNYCSRISGSVAIKKHLKCKHAYKVNFVMAVYVCKIFYHSIKKDFVSLIHDISRYTEPIRPGRSDIRNVRSTRFIGFAYRVAA